MNTKHLPLIVAIALPIIFIIALALILIVPSSRIKPQFDFVYTDQSEEYNRNYYEIEYKNKYDIKEGKLTLTPIPSRFSTRVDKTGIEYKEAPTLYYYDVIENTSREVSFADMQNETFDAGPSSPDGYQVDHDYNSRGVFELFGSDSNSGYYISKGRGKKLLTGISSPYYGGDTIKVIGWIK